MGYIVLARKWRPQGFDDLIGQEAVVTTLKNAISSGKIVHAYLFSGPRGVGKTSSARILAKALNCEKRQASNPCNECPSCRSITSGSSVDVFEIDGASNTNVESVRELRETVKYAPAGGRYKIYIIDEVHMLSAPAFNALLKTLEEPPLHVIFIFATTEPRKIPSTILSRCQHHAFRRISKKAITGQLKKITSNENIAVRDSALDMIARAADGSMRDALTLLDQASSFSDDITDRELEGLLGLPETDVILDLAGKIIKGDISETLFAIKDLAERGSDLRQIVKELVDHFRNMAIVKVARDAESIVELSQEEIGRLRHSADTISLEELTLLLTELFKLEGEIRTSINPRYTLELGLLRTSFIKGMTSIDNIIDVLGNENVSSEIPVQQKQTITQVKKKAGSNQTASAPSGNEPGIYDKEQIWPRLIERVDATDHLLACKLAEAKVVNLNSRELAIGFNGGMSVLADSVEKNSSIIKPILRELSGHNLKFKILSLPDSKSQRDVNDLKKEIFQEPIVKNAMKMFKSSLIRVRPLEEDGLAHNINKP